MKHCISGEMWNMIDVPAQTEAAVTVGAHLSEMAYKLPGATDLMVEKEYWHTLCDFAERTGALLERKEARFTDTGALQNVAMTGFTLGRLLRLVGATYDGERAGIERFSVKDTASGPVAAFRTEGDSSGDTPRLIAVTLEASVVPDIDAERTSRKVPPWFLRRYGATVMHGTLARLMSMSGEKWTDMAHAKMNATAYANEISKVAWGLLPSRLRREALVGIETPVGGLTEAAG